MNLNRDGWIVAAGSRGVKSLCKDPGLIDAVTLDISSARLQEIPTKCSRHGA